MSEPKTNLTFLIVLAAIALPLAALAAVLGVMAMNTSASGRELVDRLAAQQEQVISGAVKEAQDDLAAGIEASASGVIESAVNAEMAAANQEIQALATQVSMLSDTVASQALEIEALSAELETAIAAGVSAGTAEQSADGGSATQVEAGTIGAANDDFDVVAAREAAIAIADIDNGMKWARLCSSCHSFEEGQPHKSGPNLWAIFGANVGVIDDYAYSPAMASFGGRWTSEALDAYIEKPTNYVPGTKMAFPGFSDPTRRVDLIGYLATLAN